jgi:predicted kinase
LKETFAEYVKFHLDPNTLLITCGLPASGKTVVAQDIAKIKGYTVLRSDLIRLEVLKNQDIMDTKVAGDMNKRLSVYDELFRRADTLAKKHESGIILDATFVTQELRRRAAEIAAKNNLNFVIMHTTCSQEISLCRIGKRTAEKYESNALTEEAYLANKNTFEPVDLDDLKNLYHLLQVTHVLVDTCCDKKDQWVIIRVDKR